MHPFPWTVRRDDDEPLYLTGMPLYATEPVTQDTFALPTGGILDDDGVVIPGFNELPPAMAYMIVDIAMQNRTYVMQTGLLRYAVQLQSRRDEMIATQMGFITAMATEICKRRAGALRLPGRE